MMVQLEVSEYEGARAVFRPLDDHLAVAAMLDGNMPGCIYADNPQAPRSALACGKRRFYFAGNGQNRAFAADLKKLFLERLYFQARLEGVTAFVLYYSDGSWEPTIEEILDGRNPVKVARRYYELKTLDERRRVVAPANLVLQQVDAKLMDEINLENLDALKAEMVSECPSVEEFLKTRLGVCAIVGNEIAGWCLSEYNRGDRCEIGIETVEKFQRQGIGTLTARSLIELAQAEGARRIGWDCYKENAPSVATALKLGFEKKSDYAVYFTWVDKREL
jgi:GNAT superfamily N-acetyltransferase